MSPKLMFAATSIMVAAVIYTIAVFSERKAGVLRPWHLVLFWAGFVFDTTGTTLMAEIADSWQFDFHGITGGSAILLMLVHSTWATVALVLKRKRVLEQFHRFSLFVWVLWMIAFVSGFVGVALGAGR